MKDFKAFRNFIFIYLGFSTKFVFSDPGYLKFCSEHHKHVVQSTSCTKGLWLNVPMNPGCVCVTGVWALSDGFCDKKTAIIVGEDHCFYVGFDVRAVKFLGHTTDPFSPSILSSPIDVDSVHEIPENGLTPEIHSESSMIIGINPRRTIEREDKSVCVQLDETNKWKPVHIYMNPGRTSTKWKFGTKAKCPAPTDYNYHIGFGEMFQDSKIHSKDLVGRECQDQCPNVKGATYPNKGRAYNQPGRPSRLTPTLQHGRSFIRPNKTRIIPPPKTLEEIQKEAEEERAKVQIDMNDYQREINEQTLRMMHAQISPILLNISSDEISTREYAYFQKARKVVQSLCPEEYVPDTFLDGLMRMFRRLLWETMGSRPHNQAADEEQFGRIMDVLDFCMVNTTNSTFKFYNYTGSYNFTDRNDSDPTWPQNEQCPEPLIYGVWGQGVDGQWTILQNVSHYFHSHLKFNMTLMDFVVETAWKVVMIAHYHCSVSFNSTTAADFSTFFHQVEQFFNDKIIKRWYEKGSVENTLKIIKLVFPNYDLKRFAFGLDVCLFASQQYSDYGWNSKWIQRPKIPMTPNDLSQTKYYLPGLSNDSISTNDYAPKALNLTVLSRSKRDSTMWNGKAQCMEEYTDPVVRFGYTPKIGCRVHN